VTAAARDPSKISESESVRTVALNVNNVDEVLPHARAADVIISAVSPRNSGDALSDAAAFTNALIEIGNKAGTRLLMVGGGSSLNMPDGTSCLELTPEEILPEATGMRRAYASLVTADIDFTVLAPGGMIDPGERTAEFRTSGRTMLTNAEGEKSRISSEDFAIAMIDEIEKPMHFRTIFNVGY